VRIRPLAFLFVLSMSGCGDDSGEGPGTGTTGPGTGSDDTASSTDPSVGMTQEDSGSSTGTPPPGTTTGSEDSTTAAADDTTAAADSSSSTGEPVAFALFSDAFTEGGGIPGVHHVNGGNESPPLEWEGAPDGTMSFAVFFHDMTIDFEHSAIWNIPADVTELPQDVDHVAMPPDVPGALQCRSWTNQFGYGGPGSAANFYTFTLYAIDVAEIPGAEIDENSDLVDVQAAFEAHSLGSVTLTGQSTGP
jgi:Raf kinase inhibitor-like YbhB/YbcL family protein